MKMFADDARWILHRHGIAGKTDHPGAETHMQIIKRRMGEIANSGVKDGGLHSDIKIPGKTKEWHVLDGKNRRTLPPLSET